MSAHASQAFNIAHCNDSEDLPADQISNIKPRNTKHTKLRMHTQHTWIHWWP